MSIWAVYKRALSMLIAERAPTLWVVLAGVALGAVPIAEQVLLARVVDALALGQGAFPIIGLWAAVGLAGILAGVVVAVMADRLAHRRRLAALGEAFERAIILPISYHAEKGSGAVVRTILAGTDALFWDWLSFLREQFVALIGILVLIPTAIYMNPVMALILAVLAVGLVGTGTELLLLKHTEGVWQLVPVFLIGTALVLVGWVAVSRRRTSLRLLQATMWLFVLSGVTGLVLHFRGNILFEQESDPSIAGTAMLQRALMGATPTLAPGAMIQLGLVGLVFLFRHPGLQTGKAT